MIISAFTALLTYQQLRMLNNERITPYRAIYYSARLESYRAFSGAARRAERTLYDAVPSNFGASRRNGVTIERAGTISEAVQAAAAMPAAVDALKAELDKMEVLWPDAVLLSARASTEATDFSAVCVLASRKLERRETTYRNYIEACDRLNDDRNALRRHADDAIAAMRRILLADRVASIPAE